jgi:diguanylate cyclase (GGDEF)-like protein
MVFAVLVLSGCQLKYKPQDKQLIDISLASERVDSGSFKFDSLHNLTYHAFDNGSLVEFNKNSESLVFKVSRKYNPNDLSYSETLLLFPHYLDEVILVDHKFSNYPETIKRNTYKYNRQYSPNVYAFDIDKSEEIFYVIIRNKIAKKIEFFIDDRNTVRNYDQRLTIVFTAVYAVILTLIFVNLVFFFFIKKVSFLYYSIYILGGLLVLFFQEGAIAYFHFFSKPFFGIYSQLIWIKLPAIFFWMFIASFLELKENSEKDYRLIQGIIFLEIAIIVSLLFLSIFDFSSIFSIVNNSINIVLLLETIVAVYIPIKYALLKSPQARYLAFGLSIYMGTIIMRIYYTVDMDPTSFWLPRAFEFGLMAEALILSFGLADKTLRVIKQREAAENKFQQVDRELFCIELENSFQQKSNKTIEKYFASQSQLNKIIDSYFISSLKQLVEVRDVFYVFEYQQKIGIKHISGPVMDFVIEDYVDDNRDFLNRVCAENKACYQLYTINSKNKLPFIVIPISKKKHDNMCLFLTLPTYVDVNEDLIQDLYIFANTMTQSLVTVRKFQKTVEASRFDALTNVLNRKTVQQIFRNLLIQAKYNGNSIAIAFIDLDDFKLINDDYGHKVGDDVLQFLCQYLRMHFNDNAFVGRFGGDEFIIVFNNYSLNQIKDKIQALYQYFYVSNTHEITISLSIGVALGNKQNKLLDDELMFKAADSALYKAKNNGKNQASYF